MTEMEDNGIPFCVHEDPDQTHFSYLSIHSVPTQYKVKVDEIGGTRVPLGHLPSVSLLQGSCNSLAYNDDFAQSCFLPQAPLI